MKKLEYVPLPSLCQNHLLDVAKECDKIMGKLYFGTLNFYGILQTPSNFKISHFVPLNFQLLSICTLPSDFKRCITFIPLTFI